MDDPFVKAYHEFRDSIDLTKSGVLPDMDNLVWYLLMGVPRVPADEDTAQNSPYLAIEQRVIILKAVLSRPTVTKESHFWIRGWEDTIRQAGWQGTSCRRQRK
jgi:hypothetical protein